MHYEDCSLLLGFGLSSIPLSNTLILSLSDSSDVLLISKSRTMLPLFLRVNISYIIIVFFLGVRECLIIYSQLSGVHPILLPPPALPLPPVAFQVGVVDILVSRHHQLFTWAAVTISVKRSIRSLCHSFLSTSLQERGASMQMGPPHVGVPQCMRQHGHRNTFGVSYMPTSRRDPHA